MPPEGRSRRAPHVAVAVCIAACAAAGTLVTGAWWWYRPRHYVSTAVLRPEATDPYTINRAERTAFGDYSLASIIERRNLYPADRKQGGVSAAIRHMRERSIRVQEAESLGPVVVLSFEYSDAATAQAVNSDLVRALQATGLQCEVIDPASTPISAVEDSQGALSLATAGFGGGLALGMLCAGLWWMLRVR
jgi:hypothetical protein